MPERVPLGINLGVSENPAVGARASNYVAGKASEHGSRSNTYREEVSNHSECKRCRCILCVQPGADQRQPFFPTVKIIVADHGRVRQQNNPLKTRSNAPKGSRQTSCHRTPQIRHQLVIKEFLKPVDQPDALVRHCLLFEPAGRPRCCNR